MALAVDCIQISVDGATAATHRRVRPGSSFDAAIGAIERLVARGSAPQFVFVPTRYNVHEIVAAFELAQKPRLRRVRHRADDAHRARCRRLGANRLLRRRVGARGRRAATSARASSGGAIALSIYPWDIVTEIETRLEHPQAMLLVVPNGKVKLLNALPFSPADLRTDSLEKAWHAYRDAWRATEVRDFVTPMPRRSGTAAARERDLGDAGEAVIAARISGRSNYAAAFMIFPVSDALAKQLALRYPIAEIGAIRNGVHFLTVCGVACFWRRAGTLRTLRPGLHLLRGAIMAGTTLCLFAALRTVSLANVTTLLFVAPLFVVALSGPLLGERIRPGQWLAVGAGFVGVALVFRPALDAFDWGMPLALAARSAARSPRSCRESCRKPTGLLSAFST